MTTDEKEFLLEEYKSLKAEILSLVADSRTLETASAIAVAGILGWFTSMEVPYGPVWYLPSIIPVLGGIRSTALMTRLKDISAYIQTVEARFLQEGHKGWETTFRRRIGASRTPLSVAPTSLGMWIALLVICLAAPSLLHGVKNAQNATSKTRGAENP